jgi:hypothetical protein
MVIHTRFNEYPQWRQEQLDATRIWKEGQAEEESRYKQEAEKRTRDEEEEDELARQRRRTLERLARIQAWDKAKKELQKQIRAASGAVRKQEAGSCTRIDWMPR